MKKIVLFLLALACYQASSQILYNAPVPYTGSAPTGAPSATGSLFRIDKTTGYWYQWNVAAANWKRLGQGIDVYSSTGSPNYAPTGNMSWFAINTDNEIWHYSGSGTTWDCASCGGGADNWGTDVVNHDATLTGNGTVGSVLGLAQQAATSGQVLKWNGSAWAPGTDNNTGTTYTAGSGINITGTVISNTGDLSATNELQTLSVSTGTTTLSNSGGSMTIAGSGINTISTTGSTITVIGTEVDGSVTNELQTLSVATNTTTLSNGGGSMTIAGSGIIGVSTSGSTITVTGTEVDGSTTNEVLTISDGTDSEALGGQTLTVSGTGIATVDYVPGTNTLTIGATEVDGSISNELQTLSVATNTTTLSNGGGSVTIAGAGINSVSTSGSTITVTGTEVDGSTTNELQTLSVATNTTTLSNGGGSMTIAGAGINSVSTSGSTITVTATEVDGSTSNEIQNLSYTASTGAVGISGGGTGTTIPVMVGATVSVAGERGLVPKPLAGDDGKFLRGDGTWSNATVGGDNWGTDVVQHGTTLSGNGTSGSPLDVATDGITATQIMAGAVGTSEVSDNTLTATDLAVNVVSSVDGVTNDGGDIDLVASGIVTITPNDGANTITIGATEVDGSVSNEGSLTVGAGTGSTSVISSNTSGSTDVTLTAGSGIGISEVGNTITLTATDASTTNELQTLSVATNTTTLSNGGGSMTIAGAGINSVSTSGSTITVTGTEVDGSITNEVLTISDGTDSEALGGQTLTVSASGIATVDYVPGTNTLTIGAVEVDGSTSNEIQNLSYTASTGAVGISGGGTGTTIPVMGGATSSVDGERGLAPKPIAGDEAKFLRGDGTWANASAGGDNWGSQVVQHGTTLTGNGTGATPLDVATDGITASHIAAGAVGTSEVADGTIAYADIQNVSATDKVLGRVSVGAGPIEEISLTAAGRSLIDDVDAAAQRTTLGLGSIATQAANSVSITGGSITGITDLAVADGGTGASDASTARSNLSAAASGANTDITSVYLNNLGLKIKDTDASHGLIIVPGSNLTLDRTLTITTGNTDRNITINGDATINGLNTGDQTLSVATNTTTLSAGGGSMTIAGAGINSVSTSGSTITVTGTEVDGSVTNELQTISVATNTTTLSNGGGSMTIAGAGINSVSTSGSTITITGTEVDGSITNENLTISDGTDSENLGGQTLTVSGSGIATVDYVPATNTLTIGAVEVDGSTSNEIQNLSYTASTGAVGISGGGTGTTIPVMVGATASVAGERGLAPKPIAGDEVKFLRGDGTWATSTGADNWGSQVVQHGTTLTGNGTSGTPLDVATDGITSNEIVAGAVGTAEVADGTLTATDLAVNVVSSVDGVTNDGGDIDFIASGIVTITPNDGANTVTIGATEVDGSVSNEGSLTVGAGSGTTSVISSNTSGSTDVTLTAGTGIGISETGNTITLTAVDASTTNELQTLSVATNTTTLSAGGGSMTIAGAGINSVSTSGSTITVTGTEVDGSTTNENLTISDGTDSENMGGQTLTVSASGIATADYVPATNTLTIGAVEVDGSVTNELQTLSVATNTTTLSNGGGSMTIAGAGINSVSTSGSTITVTGTEVDGSVSNENLTISDGTDSENMGGQTLTVSASGIATVDYVPGTNTLTIGAVEVDGSTSNELQTISASGAGPTSYNVDLSNSGGSITLSEGSGIDLTRSVNTITITATDASATNELQTISVSANTTTLSNSGGSMTIAGAGINSVGTAGSTITITGTEVDGSVSNEGSLTVGAGTGSTSVISSNTSGSTDVTLTAGTGIGISETGNTITLTATDASASNEGSLTVGAGSGTTSLISSNTSGSTDVTLTAGTGIGISETGNTITLTATDASASNEGSLSVAAGGSNDSQISSNTSGSTNVTIAGGTNVTVTESGSTITIAAAGGTPTAYSIVRGYIEGQTGTTFDLDVLDGKTKDKDGTNLAFDIPTDIQSFRVYKNGVELNVTGTGTTRDYSVDATANSITLNTALATTDRVIVQSVTGSALDIYTSGELSGSGTSTNTLKLAQQSATSGQVLAWNGSQYAPRNRQLQVKGITIQNPTSSENIALFYIDRAITISKIADVVRGTSPSVTYNIRFASARDSGSPTDVFTSNRAVTSTAGTTTTSFNDATIPAASWVWMITSAQSGTVADFNITIQYTED